MRVSAVLLITISAPFLFFEFACNDYLFKQIGGFDSVQTMLVDTRQLADDPYVAYVLAHAEAIFIAGGDQATYLSTWGNTKLQKELNAVWPRNAVLGGTSAGCAVLGQFVFSAAKGTVYSDEALKDPYVKYVTLEKDFVRLGPLPHPSPLSPLANVITDSHFAQRDRLGRLLVFLARLITDKTTSALPLGLGVDEKTALLVDKSGKGRVVGKGAVYLVAPAAAPPQCAPHKNLEWANLKVHKLSANDKVALPKGLTSATATTVSATGGKLVPADPY